MLTFFQGYFAKDFTAKNFAKLRDELSECNDAFEELLLEMNALDLITCEVEVKNLRRLLVRRVEVSLASE